MKEKMIEKMKIVSYYIVTRNTYILQYIVYIMEYITIEESKRRVYIKRMSYTPITLLKKTIAYGLIGYGLVTCWLPSGSQLALLGGCALLGIPFKKVYNKIKLHISKLLFLLCVLCSKERLRYELGLLKMRFI